MPLTPDIADFLILANSLDISDIKYLHKLCKLYDIGEIPIEEYYKEVILGRVIEQINQFDSSKAGSFMVFLEGLVSGISKNHDYGVSQDLFFISGQNTINTSVESQTNTIASELMLNIDSSAIALAIEKGLVEQKQMQEILDAIGNRLNHQKSARKNIKNN